MKQQLKINLDEIHNPNKSIEKRYLEHNAMDLWLDRDFKPSYKNELRFFNLAKSSKAQIKYSINAIYRKKVGSKEYCYFNNHMITSDLFRNKVDHTRTLGRYERPIFAETRALTRGNLRSDGTTGPEQVDLSIENMEEVYPYEWNAILPQLLEWKKKNIISEDCHYYVEIDDTKYAKPYTWTEFTTLSIEDLVLLGNYGKKYDGLLKSTGPTSEMLDSIREKVKHDLTLKVPEPRR